MAKHLVIVESPAKARTLNKYLGSQYQVTASMGHVRDLPKSKMGVVIEKDFQPQYIVIAKARKTVSALKKQAKGMTAIYLAPDPDREGEAISWHLAAILDGVAGVPIHRVVFNEITKSAVLDAFKRPRAIDMNLVNAQQARRILDRIVGYNLSPLLWKNVGGGLSAGRVQSVALRLVVEREREVKAFKPQEYWTIDAKLASRRKEEAAHRFRASLEKVDGKKLELHTQEAAQKLRDAIESSPFSVLSVKARRRHRRPQAPYTTSRLQQEAFTQLRFAGARTMRIAQRLYEGIEVGEEEAVGLITYMRTDSVAVSTQARDEARSFIRSHFGKEFVPEAPRFYKARKGAQEAHEAVRPTSAAREPQKIRQYLSEEEFKLYDLIWKKFVASQMSDAEEDVTVIDISAGPSFLFRTTGTKLVFAGFLAALGSERRQDAAPKAPGFEDASDTLPHLEAGEPLDLLGLFPEQHFTKPPARFNDASLVRVLEEKGIGRPSTYAPTIQTLYTRHYIERERGAFHPTELGETVVDLLVKHFSNVLDVRFTAFMEGELDKIEEGQTDWVKVLQAFYGPFFKDLEEARATMTNVKRAPKPTSYVCDVCGKHLVEKWGRFGKFLACSGFPDCKYTRSMPTGVRCGRPECNGELVRIQSKKGRRFYGCSTYPACTFTANRLPKPASDGSEEDGQGGVAVDEGEAAEG